jgi:hypothetical protein
MLRVPPRLATWPKRVLATPQVGGFRSFAQQRRTRLATGLVAVECTMPRTGARHSHTLVASKKSLAPAV